MKREVVEPTIDEHGRENHPAFGVVSVNRRTSSPGASLFDSEILHSQYVVLTVSGADRERNLNRDWIYADNKSIVEIALSEAQWASLVSSFGSAGTSCTIQRTKEDGLIPDIPFEPRLALSTAETKNAAEKAFEQVQKAFDAYEEKKNAANLRNLKYAIANAGPNVEFAAKSLTEHTENVVEKAKADIESMVDSRARQLGIDPHIVLTTGFEGTKELEK